MPRGDGTGPAGSGPMTGRGMGRCAGYAAPGYANAGFGRGCGRGMRRMYYMTGLPGWARDGSQPYNDQQAAQQYSAQQTAQQAAQQYSAQQYGAGPDAAETAEARQPEAEPVSEAYEAEEADDKELLKKQEELLKRQLSEVRKRLKGFEKAEE